MQGFLKGAQISSVDFNTDGVSFNIKTKGGTFYCYIDESYSPETLEVSFDDVAIILSKEVRVAITEELIEMLTVGYENAWEDYMSYNGAVYGD
jgi:hypothetical protein